MEGSWPVPGGHSVGNRTDETGRAIPDVCISYIIGKEGKKKKKATKGREGERPGGK